MKRRTLGHIGLLALVLCLATTCLLGGTLAKYTTTVTGTGTGTVASWDFKANSNASAFTFTLTGTGADNTIAPGDTGTFTIELANTSDVAADYVISLSNLPENMTIKLTNAEGTAITAGNHIEGTLAQTNGSKTVTVFWAYADITAVPATTSLTMTATVVGTQAAPVNKAAVEPSVVPNP